MLNVGRIFVLAYLHSLRKVGLGVNDYGIWIVRVGTDRASFAIGRIPFEDS